MPTTGDATLHLIQQEISEVVQREKELKENHSRPGSENGIILTNGSDIHNPKPPLDRTKSSPALINGNSPTNGVRLFAQNATTKGVMQRFIKSRGKLTTAAPISSNKNQTAPSTWASLEFVEPPKPIVPAGMQPRNGFVPVEERIRKEFQEMQKRESELRVERQKSQPDLLALLDSNSPEPERRSLRSARSVSQLSDFEAYEENGSAPASLKTARSLAELCDVDDDEEAQPPGSLTLIKQWENLIQKNQQAHST